jgi:hypothetical protein
MNTDVVKPSYLKLLEVPITFDCKDHPNTVPQPGSYPLVVAPSVQIQKDPQGLDGWGKRDQRALRIYA